MENTESAPQRHYRTCPFCEAMCGLVIHHRAGRVEGIRADTEDVFSHGHICPKATALRDIHEDKDRLETPLIKRNGDWVRADWDEALDFAAAGILRTQKRHGNDAMAMYQGNPSVHNVGLLLYSQVLAKVLKTRSRFSATSVDQLPHHVAAALMFGNQFMLPVADVDRTDFLLLLGGNPIISGGSMMSAPGMRRRIRALQQRGGQLVVVDPRRSETAKLADQHVFIRPQTDGLLLAAVLNQLERDGAWKIGRLAPHIRGLPELARTVAPFAPSEVAQATGVPADTIIDLARRFAAAPSAVAFGRIGVCVQEFGGVNQCLIHAINVVTGNLDRPGGMMFPKPPFDLRKLLVRIGDPGSFSRRTSRVSKMPRFGGEWPLASFAEEALTPGEGQIRGLLCSAGNPALSAPNTAQVEAALAQLDFHVSIDFYLNETSRHAHVILPPTDPLIRDHYDIALQHVSTRNVAKYSPPLVEREPGQRYDWEIVGGLITRLLRGRGLRGRAAAAGLKPLLARGPRGMIALGLRTSSYRISLRDLEQAPHGIDLGPLKPALPAGLCSTDKKIDVCPRRLVDDIPRLARQLALAAADELVLISRRELRSHNSWLHNSPRLVKGGVRCPLAINPVDAEKRGLREGDTVRISSAVGHVDAPLAFDGDLMPGVVSLAIGWGHTHADTKLATASERPGVAINLLTDHRRIDPFTGTAALNGQPVKVEPLGESATLPGPPQS